MSNRSACVAYRYRANLALGLAERSKDPRQPFVVDEWTSELDRDLARVVSVAFSKRMSKEWALKPAQQVVEAAPEAMEEDAWEGAYQEAKEEELQEEDPVVEDQAEAGLSAWYQVPTLFVVSEWYQHGINTFLGGATLRLRGQLSLFATIATAYEDIISAKEPIYTYTKAPRACQVAENKDRQELDFFLSCTYRSLRLPL